MSNKKNGFAAACVIGFMSIAPAHADQTSADQISDLRAEIKILDQKVDALSRAQTIQAAQTAQVAKRVATRPVEIRVVAVPPLPKPFIPPQFAPVLGAESPFTVGNDTVSITPYGILSVGLMNVSNSGGKSITQLASGTRQPSRIGAKFYYNLKDDWSALVVFELGYSSVNGSLGQGGRIFGRQVYAGFSNGSYGTLTAGRQNDDMSSALWWSEGAAAIGGMGARIGDNDNVFQTNRLNNDLKYTTPVIHGVHATASYAFSDSTETRNNNAYSAAILYDGRKMGQGLRVGAGVLVLNKPDSTTNNMSGAIDNDSYGYSSPFVASPIKHAAVNNQRACSVSTSYTVKQLTMSGSYSNVQFNYLDATSLNLNNAEIYASYYITPKLLGGIDYIYTWGRYTANGAKPNYSQVSAGFDYFINRYVDLNLIDTFQVAGGSAKYAWIFGGGESSTNTQNMVIFGTRIQF